MLNRIWRFAEFQFHESSLELRRENTVVPAETKAREVLRYLLSNAERQVVSPAEIKDAVWGKVHVSDSSVNVAVNKIRDDITNAGGNYVDEALVVDGNLITSRVPDDLPVFNQALVDALQSAVVR